MTAWPSARAHPSVHPIAWIASIKSFRRRHQRSFVGSCSHHPQQKVVPFTHIPAHHGRQAGMYGTARHGIRATMERCMDSGEREREREREGWREQAGRQAGIRWMGSHTYNTERVRVRGLKGTAR